jgi:hypothetical protein
MVSKKGKESMEMGATGHKTIANTGSLQPEKGRKRWRLRM